MTSLLLLMFSGAFIVSRQLNRAPENVDSDMDMNVKTANDYGPSDNHGTITEVESINTGASARVSPPSTSTVNVHHTAPITPPKELETWCNATKFPETKTECIEACSRGACCIGHNSDAVYAALDIREQCNMSSPTCLHYSPCWDVLKVGDLLKRSAGVNQSDTASHQLPSISNTKKHCRDDRSSLKCQKLCSEALCCHPDNHELCEGLELSNCGEYAICWEDGAKEKEENQDEVVPEELSMLRSHSVIPPDQANDSTIEPMSDDGDESIFTPVPDDDDVSILSFFCRDDLLAKPGGFDNCQSACIPFQCCFQEGGCLHVPYEIDCSNVKLCSIVFSSAPVLVVAGDNKARHANVDYYD